MSSRGAVWGNSNRPGRGDKSSRDGARGSRGSRGSLHQVHNHMVAIVWGSRGTLATTTCVGALGNAWHYQSTPFHTSFAITITPF